MDVIKNFLEVNQINAKLFSFKEETTPGKVIAINDLPKNILAKAIPFVDERMDFFVLIKLVDEEITLSEEIELIEEQINKIIKEINSKETEKLTGFEKKIFPPIAVFGTKTFFTNKALEKKELLFVLSEKDFLLISPKEIIKAQEISDSFL